MWYYRMFAQDSGSQTYSSRYPNQGSDYVLLPSIFCLVKKATSYNTEQHCGFRSSLPPEESHSTPSFGTTGLGIIYAALR